MERGHHRVTHVGIVTLQRALPRFCLSRRGRATDRMKAHGWGERTEGWHSRAVGTAARGRQQVSRGLTCTDRRSHAGLGPAPTGNAAGTEPPACELRVHTSSDRQLRAAQAPLERQCHGSRQGAVRPGSGAKSQGAWGTAAAARQGPAWHSSLQPNPVWERDSAQLTSQAAPFSGVSEPAHCWGRLAAAFSSQQKGHLRKHPIWDVAGPHRLQAGPGSLSPHGWGWVNRTCTPPGALLFLPRGPGPRTGPPASAPPAHAAVHHGWVFSVPCRPRGELLGWE